MKVEYKCPSNIALVKYWGKKPEGIQLPANPSISFNLKDLYAQTSVEIIHGNVSGQPSFTFTYENNKRPSFEPKIAAFLNKIWDRYSLVREFSIHINTSNNFPHGTGIASSAAGFGALALCLARLQEQVTSILFKDFWQEASNIARLGSGSACRSMYSKPAIWGAHPTGFGNDEYAVPMNSALHDSFENMMDAVLIVDGGEKAVSSSAGHNLLKNNPYAPARFSVANQNLISVLDALEKGQFSKLIHIVESEALQLHAMMMVSNPYYILMRPNTLAIIEKVWKYRQERQIPVMFTLDAGANVHLIFQNQYHSDVMNLIQDELLVYTEKGQYLCSAIGGSPEEVKN